MHKKLILLTLLFGSLTTHPKSLISSAQQNQLNETARAWSDTHQELDLFSLQLVGNFLYFSYKLSILDKRVSKRSAAMTTVLKKTMSTIKTYDNPKGATTLLAYTIHQLRTASDTRYDVYMSWKHCNTYIKEHGNNELKNALKEVQHAGAQFMDTYTRARNPSIDQSIAQTQSTLEAEQSNIKTSLNLLEQLLESIDPASKNTELLILNYALNTGSIIEQNGWNIISACQPARTHLRDIFSAGETFFFAYYKALYRCIEECDEQYHMILFSPHGFITKVDQNCRLKP